MDYSILFYFLSTKVEACDLHLLLFFFHLLFYLSIGLKFSFLAFVGSFEMLGDFRMSKLEHLNSFSDGPYGLFMRFICNYLMVG